MYALVMQVAIHQHNGLIIGFGKCQGQVDRGQRLALPGSGAGDHYRVPAFVFGQMLNFSS